MNRYASCALFLSTTTALTGCMLSPTDGDVMTNLAAAVPFSGYSTNPNDPVQVEAFDGVSWGAIANTASETTPFNYDNTDLYQWGVNAVVPASKWRPGTTGFAAQVRARVGTSLENNAVTFTPDWIDCRNNGNQKLLDFVNHCSSPRSPHVYLYSSNYPASVDLTITNLARAGGLRVSVRNGGRPGRVTRLECFKQGGAVARDVNTTANPVETQIVDITSLQPAAGETVTCTVFGVNENGSPEANTANNSRTQVVF
jgi:hypothetical protein